MKKLSLISLTVLLLFSLTSFTFAQPERLSSSKAHIKFFSSTKAEDIEAHNHTSVSVINTKTGEVNFSVPMQGFEFEKSLMQKHFNQKKFLDTKQFPQANLMARITNLSDIDFSKDGKYKAVIDGNMTIKGVSNPIKDEGTITVKGNTVLVETVFDITLSDYQVNFVKGKPSRNIAKTVKVTAKAEYKPEI